MSPSRRRRRARSAPRKAVRHPVKRNASSDHRDKSASSAPTRSRTEVPRASPICAASSTEKSRRCGSGESRTPASERLARLDGRRALVVARSLVVRHSRRLVSASAESPAEHRGHTSGRPHRRAWIHGVDIDGDASPPGDGWAPVSECMSRGDIPFQMRAPPDDTACDPPERQPFPRGPDSNSSTRPHRPPQRGATLWTLTNLVTAASP